MHKRDAIRLKPGDNILFGHSASTEKIQRYGTAEIGRVIFVTPSGGIKVRNNETEAVKWVPYHHVWQKLKDWQTSLDTIDAV